jgi:DNA-binding MarR family transcriptional regulator
MESSISVDEVIQILGSTVKHDDENKAITFLTKLLTYTEEDQINLGFLAESSTGKSYIPLELSWYFPKEDVIKLGYASPTAFFHDYGVLMHKEGIPVNFDMKPNKAAIKEDLEIEKGNVSKDDVESAYKREMRKWKELLKGSYYMVDLHQKIVIFLDMPHDMLLQRLRSLLSHDDKEIVLKITDKREKGGLRTKTVVIRGFPTVIFCSAKFGLADQEKTRLLLLSPEINQEKLRESIMLKIEKESDREAFEKRMMEDPQRNMLKQRVQAVKDAKIKYVKIPEEKRAQIYQQFLEDHNFLIPRHQRDISRLLAVIKAHALLNFMHRERVGDAIIVADEDVIAGFKLYYGISEANEMGLSPELFNVYSKLKPYFNDDGGLNLIEFQTAYYKEFHKPIGYDSARKILKTLTSVGLLTEKPDPNDRRMPRYFVFEGGVKKSAQVEVEEFLPPSEKQNSFSIPEVYETLRKRITQPFYTNEAVKLIREVRQCEPEEAEKIFEVLQTEGRVFLNAYGLWEWVK